jgi:PAS domain S-box-containing protein
MSPHNATVELKVRTGAQPAGNPFEMLSAQAILDALPSAAVVVDEDICIVAVNRRAAEFIGYNPVQSIGRPLEGVFRAILDRFQSLVASGIEPLFEHHFNGTWYVVRTFPIPTPDGRALRCITAFDISARKANELEIRESEAQLEEATRIAQLGTFKYIWDGTRVEWSPYMYVLHDVSTETYDPVSRRYIDFVHPDDRDHATRLIKDMRAGKAVADMEYRIVRPNGAVRWMRLDALILFDADGLPHGSFGVCQDITDQKNREQELNDLLRRNATLYEALEASPIGVAVLTREQKSPGFLYVNTEFQRLTLHNSFSLRGRGLEALQPEVTEESWAGIGAALEGSTSGSFELTCARRDKTTFLAQIEIAPVLDFPGREAVAYVLNLRDITGDRQRAAALLQSQKMEALGQLSGGVAHEINNLLQPVIALSELGFDVAERDPAKVRRYFDVIGNSGRKARDIVRQVLTFARRDAPDVASYPIAPLVSDALDLAQSGLPPGIVLLRRIAADNTCAVVNPTQLSQVVLNLIRNAADASNGNGEIEVSLSAVKLDDVAAAHLDLSPGPWLCLVVTDHGCGMDRYTVSRILEPFFTTKAVGRGTGLGLSVVYSVVTGWGGNVRIESEVDQGTSAMIYIPVDSNRLRSPSASNAAGGAE